jgi:hypothetical protein
MSLIDFAFFLLDISLGEFGSGGLLGFQGFLLDISLGEFGSGGLLGFQGSKSAYDTYKSSTKQILIFSTRVEPTIMQVNHAGESTPYQLNQLSLTNVNTTI